MPQTVPGPIPRPLAFCPHAVVEDLRTHQLANELLEYALQNQDRFEASRIGSGSDVKIDPKRRISAVCPLEGSLQEEVGRYILALLPEVLEPLGLYPFNYGKIETELAAHGDGAFFVRHTDVRRDILGAGSTRHITGVLYFHSQPRQFQGGTLRLYAVDRSSDPSWHDFEPRHGSILFFPSGLLHEVLPVQAPQAPFEHQRFALNIWVHKENAPT